MYQGWYRAQVASYDEGSDECDVKFVDYGGYMRMKSSVLRQIRYKVKLAFHVKFSEEKNNLPKVANWRKKYEGYSWFLLFQRVIAITRLYGIFDSFEMLTSNTFATS